MNNFAAKKLFTESLRELVNEKLTVYQAVKILSESKLTEKKIRMAADYVAEYMEEGGLFSGAIKTCPIISFDSVYVFFISFAEKSGNLAVILEYLEENCRREEENRNAFEGSLGYPLLVLIILFAVFIFFLSGGQKYFGEESFFGIEKLEALRFVLLNGFVFALATGVFIAVLWKIMEENRLCEAFRAGSFLVKSGTGFASAVGMAAWVCRDNSSHRKMFEKAREGLEYGMDLRSAFLRESDIPLKRKIETALFIAEETGNKNDVLEKIADTINRENMKKRKLCLTLIEPVLIVFTGCFLLRIALKFILPAMTGFGL